MPSLIKPGCEFSCTDNVNSSQVIHFAPRCTLIALLFVFSVCKVFAFSCEFQDKDSKTSGSSDAKRTKFVTLAWHGSKNRDNSSEVIPLPVPYELPPKPYSSEG